jgi:hypothetical protein
LAHLNRVCHTHLVSLKQLCLQIRPDTVLESCVTSGLSHVALLELAMSASCLATVIHLRALAAVTFWTCPYADEPAQCGFLGDPGGINDEGEVAAAASMADGSTHAVRWREGGAPFDLGCFRGRDSGAAAINSAGLVVGWVCIDPVNRGQMNFRPAAWANDNMLVLENFCCDWGQAVDVNDTGLVLVLGYVGMRESRAILWNPSAGTTKLIGEKVGSIR